MYCIATSSLQNRAFEFVSYTSGEIPLQKSKKSAFCALHNDKKALKEVNKNLTRTLIGFMMSKFPVICIITYCFANVVGATF